MFRSMKTGRSFWKFLMFFPITFKQELNRLSRSRIIQKNGACVERLRTCSECSPELVKHAHLFLVFLNELAVTIQFLAN